MITHPLEKILERIRYQPNSTYVWVSYRDATGFQVSRSIKVQDDSAVEWCKQTAKDLNGQVPGFVGTDIFLGVCPT